MRALHMMICVMNVYWAPGNAELGLDHNGLRIQREAADAGPPFVIN